MQAWRVTARSVYSCCVSFYARRGLIVVLHLAFVLLATTASGYRASKPRRPSAPTLTKLNRPSRAPSELEVVAHASSLTQARQMLDTPLDVAVVDLALPGGDGKDLVRELRWRPSGISVVVLSAIIEPRHLEAVLKAGADVVLHKVASIPTIVEEVRRLAGR